MDFSLTRAQEELIERATAFGLEWQDLANGWDTANKAPLAEVTARAAELGLIAITVPKEHGGLGAGYRAYMTTAAEIGRYCGATALTYNMHVCSCLWSGPLADDLDMSEADRAEHNRRRAIHYARIVCSGFRRVDA